MDDLVRKAHSSRPHAHVDADARHALKLFLATTSLHPAYGGPAYSVSRLATALASAGVDVGLWASDQSAPATGLLPAESAVKRLAGGPIEAVDRFGRADIVHDNGIWRAHHHQIARLAVDRGIPRVVSTRGMLEPWAMRHKPFRKQLGWRFYQRRDLASAACHHATADAEAENLRRLGLRVPIRVIPNGVDMPDAVEKTKSAERHALFIGRIYPVKGLPMLIDAWARVRPHGWTLKIGGPDEAGHRREVEKGIEAAGLQGTVSFLGPVDGPMKQSALEAADLFVLPSHSESFGMAVAEALAHGLPVLTTTAAPWPMLTGRGCGWWVPPTVDGLTDGLRRATSTDPATLYEMGARGRAFVAAEFAWDNVAKQFIAMYEALARHAQPC